MLIYGLKFRVMHNFLTQGLPSSLSSFSQELNRGFGRPSLSGIGAGFRPVVTIVPPGLCLFTHPTIQCSPSLGHAQSG